MKRFTDWLSGVLNSPDPKIEDMVNYQKPTPSPQVKRPNTDPILAEVERKIRAGLMEYSRGEPLPMQDYVPNFVDAASKYDLFRYNPYLMPSVGINETSGGKNITFDNNLINYGIKFPKINAEFKATTMDDALNRSLKEMGQTGQVYKRFRTGKPLTDEELLDFANTYEPTNGSYYNQIKGQIGAFERQ